MTGSKTDGSPAPNRPTGDASCAPLGPHGTLKQLFEFFAHRQLQGLRGGTDELLAVKPRAQTNHMSGHGQFVTIADAHGIDLALDGVCLLYTSDAADE